jgi:peptidoglycan hydrolase-like protein with peptidoglycan-binding domain
MNADAPIVVSNGVSGMNLQNRQLGLDSQGEDVASLHNQLLNMGGSIDAAELAMKLFGNTTRRRVAEFQEQTALPPTGVVDEDTASAIDRAAGGAGGMEAEDKAAAVRINDSIAVPADRSGSGSAGEPGLADSPLGGQPSHGHPAGLGDLLDTLPAALALTPGQRETLTGAPLLALSALWLLGRVAMISAARLPRAGRRAPQHRRSGPAL